MTDLVTGNQIDIAAFDSGMSNDDKRKQLRGTRFADWVERGVQNTLTSAVSGIQAASREQEGWHDDVLRGIGTGAKWVGQKWQEGTADQEGIGDDILRSIGGGAKNTMRALDAASYYGGKIGGKLSEAAGFDPRIGGAIGNVAGDVLLGGAVKKATQVPGKVLRAVDDLAGGLGGTGGAAAMRGSGTTLRPLTFKDTRKWNAWVKKFGSEKGARQAADIEKEALKFWNAQKKINADGKGSLKDFGTIREIEGKQYYIKNKANSLKAPNFNYDPLEKTIAGRILREQSAKVDEKMVKKAVARINKNRKKMGTELITDEQVAQYIAAQKKNKSDLKRLIRNLNYDEGKRTWSLGHIEAVEAHRKKGKAGADMISNLELEPFKDMFDEATGRWIRGNASRSNKDELADILLQAINKAETIDEDIIKFLDPVVGNFWPRKIGVKDRKTWLKQSGLMEEYIKTLKKKGVNKTIQDSGVADTSVFKPTPLPGTSK